VAPAQSLDDWAGLALGKIEAIVALERVGLQNAGVAGQMPLGMRAPPSFRLTSRVFGATKRPVPMINSAPLAL
jgi:hypothetical protein